MAKQLDVFINIKDNFSKVNKELNRQLKQNENELKLQNEILKANARDKEALANKERLLAQQTELYTKKIAETSKYIKASNVELEKKKNAMNVLEKDVKSVTFLYQKYLRELGEEDKLTKQTLKELNKKQSELRKANREYNTLANSVQKYNTSLIKSQTDQVKVSRSFAETTIEANKLEMSLDKLSKKDFSHIADNMMRFGASLGTALAGVTALGANADMKFEYGNAKISTITPNGVDINKMGVDIRKLSDDLGTGIDEIQNAYYQALSSGMEFEQVQELVSRSIETSKASFSSLEGVIDVATSIINAWKLSVEDTDRVMNALFKTTELGKITMSELSNDLGRVVAASSQAGLEVEQILTAIAQASLGGIRSNEGITYLNSMLSEMSKTGTKVSDIIKNELGMSFQQAIKQGIQLSQIIDVIENSGISLTDAFGSQEAGRMAAVLSDGETYLDLLDKIENSSGVVDMAFDKVDSTKFAEFEKTINRLKNSFIDLGIASEPLLNMFIDGVDSLAESISKVEPDTIKTLAAISALSLGLGGLLKVGNKVNGLMKLLGKNMSTGLGGIATGVLNPLTLKLLAIPVVLGSVAIAFDKLNVTAEEQSQKVNELTSEYDKLKSEIDELNSKSNRSDIENDMLKWKQLELEASEQLIEKNKELLIQKELFGKGVAFDGGLVKDTAKSLSEMEYLQQRIDELKDYANSVQDETTKGIAASQINENYDRMLEIVPELNAQLEAYRKSLDGLSGEQKEQVYGLIEQIEIQLKYIYANTSLTDSLNENTEALSENKEVMGENAEAYERMTAYQNAIEYANNLSQSMETLSSKNMDMANNVEFLNSCIDTLTKSQVLSQDQIVKLIDLCPELSDKITEQNGVYVINADALEQVKESSIITANQRIADEIAVSKELAVQAQNRIAIYQAELNEMKKLVRGKSILESTVIGSNKQMMGYSELTTEGSLTENAMNSVNNRINAGIANEKKLIQDLLNGIEKLEIEQKKFEVKTSGAHSKAVSDSKSKAKKDKKSKEDYEKYYSQLIDEKIDIIMAESERLEQTIELTEKKLADAQLRGDKETESKLQQDLIEYAKKKKDLTTKTADELRKIGNDARIQLSGMKIKGYEDFNFSNVTDLDIAKISQQYEKSMQGVDDKTKASIQLQKDKFEELSSVVKRIYSDEIPQLIVDGIEQGTDIAQKSIDEIERYLEEFITGVDNKIRDIEMEQLLLDPNSKEYMKKEREKANFIIEQQTMVMKVINEMRAKKYSDESEHISKLKDQWYGYEKDRINIIKNIAEKEKQARIDAIQKSMDTLEAQKKAIEDLTKLTMDMIKQEVDAKKKAIQDEIDGYEKIINKKKESLKDEKEEKDYQKELSEIEKQEKVLNDKLLELSMDNSGNINEKKLELEEELRSLLEKKEELQNNKSLEKQQELLDKELEAYEKKKQEELDKLDDYLDKEGQIRQDALNMIEKNNTALYEKLLKYNATYGDAMQEDIVDAWKLATDAADEFNNGQMDLLDVLKSITDEMADQVKLQEELKNKHWSDIELENGNANTSSGGGTTSGSDWHSKKDDAAKKMQSNSKEWFNASDEKKKELSQENERLAQQIGAWKGSDGEWWIMVNGKRMKLYDSIGVRHTGIKTGFVGGKALTKGSQDFFKLMNGEELNILKAGELVVNTKQMDNAMKNIIPNISSRNIGSVPELKIEGGLINLVIQGNADKDTVKLLRKETERIANYTIDKIKDGVYSMKH